jgi:hypothetical protein
MVDIIHRIGIKSSASEVYKALTSLEGLSNGGLRKFREMTSQEERSNFSSGQKQVTSKVKMVMEVKELNPGKDVPGAA